MLRLGDVAARELAASIDGDQRIWVIDGDLGDSYGLAELAPRFGGRHVQAGIAEQTMVSLAAGLATEGARPWVFSFAAFLCCRAYDQIRVCVGQTRLPVTLVGSHAGGCAGPNGQTHAIMNDLALMSTLPGIDVWAPADAAETKSVVRLVLAAGRPAYIRLPRDPQPDLIWPDSVDTAACTVFGSSAPVALIATGLGTQWAIQAQTVLRAQGVRLPVVHVPCVEPFPVDEVAAAIRGAQRLVIIEDHSEVGGLADIVRRIYPDRAIRNLGWPRAWTGASGDPNALRGLMGLDDGALATACLAELKECHQARNGIIE